MASKGGACHTHNVNITFVDAARETRDILYMQAWRS